VTEPDLSAVVLCYRAGEDARRVVEPLSHLLREARVDHELVLVANFWPGEPDETPRVVRELEASVAEARSVIAPKAGGMGWDLRSGLAAARGRFLVAIDGDAQNPVADVLRAYEALRASGADVVKGRRVARYDGVYRRVVSLVYNVAFRALFGTRGLWDVNAKPKGLTREAYERLDLRADDWFVDAELVLQARRLGMRVVEVPVIFNRNDSRPSFVHASAILEFVRNMLRERVRH
jgi:glycosyltransferase involved in cell wall biosynthesis